MEEVFSVVLSLLAVTELLVIIFFEIHAKNSWKTTRIRELVYAGVIDESRHDANFTESRAFKKKFRKIFNHYDINIVTDGGPIKAGEVETFSLELVINDIYEEIKKQVNALPSTW